MRRRKFLIGAGSFAAASAGAIGTGAFTQVTAQREIELAIQPDKTDTAYLNFSPVSDYAEYDGGTLLLSFGNNGTGTGLNSRANSLFEDVFRIENQGTDPVDVLMPSFVDVSKSSVQQATAAASTNFLVDATDSPVSDPEGVKLCGPSETKVSVDKVDISWPEGISPTNKPSNPVPQDTINCNDRSGSGSVNESYAGLRYPGGTLSLGVGDSATVDVRFTVSNKRSSVDRRDAGLLYKAKTGAVTDDDWEV